MSSQSSFTGFMSGANQFGRWIPPSEVYAKALMGGCTLDFSHAIFIQPVVTVHTKAMWGGITIIVPPNVVVEQNGTAIMGGFGGSGGLFHNTGDQASTAGYGASNLILRVSGTSLMGGVSVTVNRRAPPAQLVSIAEAERLVREPLPFSSSPLDIVGDVLGGVLGGLVGGAMPQQTSAPSAQAGSPPAGFSQPTPQAPPAQPQVVPTPIAASAAVVPPLAPTAVATQVAPSAVVAPVVATAVATPVVQGVPVVENNALSNTLSTVVHNAPSAPAQVAQLPQRDGPWTIVSRDDEDDAVSQPTDTAERTGVAGPTADWKQELRELKGLFDEGILTQDEFDHQKKLVLQQARS